MPHRALSADLIKGCWLEADQCTAGTGAGDDTAWVANKIGKAEETSFGAWDGFTIPGSHLTTDDSKFAFDKKTFTATGTHTSTFHDEDTLSDPAPDDNVVALPGSIAGAGLPGLVIASAGLLALSWWRRKRRPAA